MHPSIRDAACDVADQLGISCSAAKYAAAFPFCFLEKACGTIWHPQHTWAVRQPQCWHRLHMLEALAWAVSPARVRTT